IGPVNAAVVFLFDVLFFGFLFFGATLAAAFPPALGTAGPVGLHDCKDRVGVFAIDAHAATAMGSVRQAVFEVSPVFACVGGFVEARIGPVFRARRAAGKWVAA